MTNKKGENLFMIQVAQFMQNNLYTLKDRRFQWAGFYHQDSVSPPIIVDKIMSPDGKFKVQPLRDPEDYPRFANDVFELTKEGLCTNQAMWWWKGSYEEMIYADKHSINLGVSTVLAGINRSTPVPDLSRDEKIKYIENVIRQSEGEYRVEYKNKSDWNKVAETAYNVIEQFEGNGKHLTYPQHLLNALDMFHKEMRKKRLYNGLVYSDNYYATVTYSRLQITRHMDIVRIFEEAWAASQLFRSPDISDFELYGKNKPAKVA